MFNSLFRIKTLNVSTVQLKPNINKTTDVAQQLAYSLQIVIKNEFVKNIFSVWIINVLHYLNGKKWKHINFSRGRGVHGVHFSQPMPKSGSVVACTLINNVCFWERVYRRLTHTQYQLIWLPLWYISFVGVSTRQRQRAR